MFPDDSLAARAKTILLTSPHVEIGVHDRRRLLPSHLLTLEGEVLCNARHAAGPCVVHLLRGRPSPPLDLWAADVGGAAQPDRLRGAVRARGVITPVDEPVDDDVLSSLHADRLDNPVVAFVPESVHVVPYDPARGWVAPVEVPLPDYEIALPDPLAGWEQGWLAHLAGHHESDLRELADGRVGLLADDVVRPLLADERGLTLRVYAAGGSPRDIQVGFPRLARCGHDAVAALRTLVGPPASRPPQR